MKVAPPVIKRNEPLSEPKAEQPVSRKPLSYVKIKGRANNKIEIMRRSSTPTRRKGGDCSAERQTEIRGQLLAAIEHLNLLIKATEAGHEIFTPHKPDPFAYETEQEYKRAELEWRQTYFVHLPIGVPGKDVYREYRRDPDTKLRQPTNCLVNWRVDGVGFYELYDADELKKAVKALQERLLGGSETDSFSYLDILRKLQDIEGVFIPKSPPRKIGDDNPTRPFSQNGRNQLLEAGAVIDRACGLNAVEVTLTLPGSTDESVRALAAYSWWLINNLFQIVRDWKKSHVKGIVDAEGKEIIHNQWVHLVRRSFQVSASEPFLVEGEVKRSKHLSPNAPKELQPRLQYFYAWEHQHRGALHMHICLAAPPEDVSIEWLEHLGHLLKDEWFKLLKKMSTTEIVTRHGKQSGPLPGVDMFERNPRQVKRGEPISWRERPDIWQWHVLRISKSVAGYFSKYAGKGAAAAKLKKDEEGSFCPTRWWGSSELVKEAIKAQRFEYIVPYSWEEDAELTALVGEVLSIYPPVIDHTVEWMVKTTYTETARDYDLTEGRVPQLVQTGERSRQREKVLVNGVSRHLYFAPEEFPEVSSLFRSLKPNFEEFGATSYQRRIDGAVKVTGVNPDTNTIEDSLKFDSHQLWLSLQDKQMRELYNQTAENLWENQRELWALELRKFEPRPEEKRPSFSDLPLERLLEIEIEMRELGD